MFSLGIEYERAFSIAFCSARFASGSGPPSFAATMIARESLEKSWPRFASAAPFLCLMLDHLLCPDTARLLDQLQEQLVDAQVLGQLGVERREQEPTVTDEDGVAGELAEHFDVRACVSNARRPDEDATKRNLVLGEGDVRLEAPHLPSEGVAVDGEVGETPVVAVEDDHPGAGAEDRTAVAANRIVEAVELGQAHDRRGLASGDDEPVEPLELVGQPYFDDVCSQLAQRCRVLAERSLQSEYSDQHWSLHRRVSSFTQVLSAGKRLTSRGLRAARRRRVSSRRSRPSVRRARRRRPPAPSRRRSAWSPRRSPSRAS